MTKGKALFGAVVVLAVAGAAMAAGLFGISEEVAKWFPPAKWFGGDRAEVQGPARGAGPRVIAVEVVTAVKRETPVLIDALGTVTCRTWRWRSRRALHPSM
jgi:hypothetical protein